MKFVSEHVHVNTYADFLRRLDTIEQSLCSEDGNFDPVWSLARVESDTVSVHARQTWYMYQIVSVLKTIIKGPVVGRATLFPTLSFYTRLQTELPKLDMYFKKMNRIGANPVLNDDDFFHGVLLWELLQALNPQSCPQAGVLWEALYHRSPAWKLGFTSVPPNLHAQLRAYFYTKSADAKIIVLNKLRGLGFHAYLQAEITPASTLDAFQSLERNLRSNLHYNVLHFSIENIEEDYQKRLRIFTFLQTQLASTMVIDAATLERALRTDVADITDYFDSSIESSNSQFFYLKPADKLKFLFDAIVFQPTESFASSEIGMFAYSLGRAILPSVVTNYIVNYMTTSPGKSYIQKFKPNYQPIEFNPYIYNDIATQESKKNFYREDGKKLLNHLTERLEQEISMKRQMAALHAQIEAYQHERSKLLEEILDVMDVLHQRIDCIVQYKYCPNTVSQFDEVYRRKFGTTTLETKAQLLHDHLVAIPILAQSNIKQNSPLDIIRQRLNDRITVLNEEASIVDVTRHFKELVDTTKHYESKFQQDQAHFSFPATNRVWQKKFPYLSLLTLILASVGLAVSIGILFGNPYFTFLVLPALLKYTVPICAVTATFGASLIAKSGLDLLRYRFFSVTFLSTQQEAPRLTSELSVLNI